MTLTTQPLCTKYFITFWAVTDIMANDADYITFYAKKKLIIIHSDVNYTIVRFLTARFSQIPHFKTIDSILQREIFAVI